MNHRSPIGFTLAAAALLTCACAAGLSSALAQGTAETAETADNVLEKPRKLVPRPIPGMPVTAPDASTSSSAPTRSPSPAVELSAAPARAPILEKPADTSAAASAPVSAGPARVLAIHRSSREKSPDRYSQRTSLTPTPPPTLGGVPPQALEPSIPEVSGVAAATVTGTARILAIHRSQRSRSSASEKMPLRLSAEDMAAASAAAPLQEGKIRIISRRAERNMP